MIKVLFFARVREQLGIAEIDFDYSPRFETIDDIRTELCREEGEVWDEVLNAENIIISCNHAVVDESQAVKDGDEIAFYPPVTGG